MTVERCTNPTPWHREMRGRVIEHGLELNEQTDAVLALCSAQIEPLCKALSIARTALLTIERRSEEARAELTRAHEQSKEPTP